jgi:hypothetical protein
MARKDWELDETARGLYRDLVKLSHASDHRIKAARWDGFVNGWSVCGGIMLGCWYREEVPSLWASLFCIAIAVLAFVFSILENKRARKYSGKD